MRSVARVTTAVPPVSSRSSCPGLLRAAPRALLLKRFATTPPQGALTTDTPSLRIAVERVRGPKEDLVSKIRGIFFGAAVGDAIGRTVEGESSLHANLTPVLLPPGSWTSETDQLLVLADSLAATNRVQPTDFAARLHQWSNQGLPNAPRRLPAYIADKVLEKVLKAENYASSPVATAKHVWESEGKVAASGGLVRSALLGAVDMFDTPRIVSNARNICLVRLARNPTRLTTHADPRCVASSVLVASFMGAVLRGGIRLGALPSELRPVVQLSVGLGIQELETEKQIRDLQQCVRVTSLDALKLTDDAGHVYKALGAGLFALFNFRGYEEGVSQVALAGGQSPTNTALAGALLGAHYGFAAIPPQWLSAVSRQAEIEQRVKTYLQSLGL